MTSKYASFRGVKFNVESHEHETGRRAVKHEYPKHDDAFLEDLGRKTREFTINGFVSGKFCRDQRDRLLKVCEEEGPGALIHPHYGQKEVVCTGCRVSESALERGIIYFTLQFTESGPPIIIDLIPSFLKDLAAFDLIGKVSDFIADTYDTLDGSSDTLWSVTELFDRSISPVTALNRSLGSFYSSFSEFKADILNLVLDPGRCVNTVVQLFAPMSAADLNPSHLVGPIAHAFSKEEALGIKPETKIDSLTPEQRKNLDAVIMMRLIALSSLLKSETLTEDLDDEDWKALFDVIDCSLEEILCDEIFAALARLRAELLVLINAENRKRFGHIKLIESLSSLVLSYQLYGSLDREDELLELNPTPNPCFVGPGEVVRYAI
jgi:prophage DNA circulation protein